MSEHTEGKHRGARVLLVDDDDAFRFAMRKALSRRGYVIDEARGGQDALESLQRALPDAMLLDLHMPDLDGLEVLRRVPRSAARTVILTGHGTVEAAVDAMKLGAFSFLEKPVDAEVLEPLLDQAIGERGFTMIDVRDDGEIADM